MTGTATVPVTDLARQYRAVRRASAWLAEPMTIEDQVAQSMPDASPVKWHLAHTTWFFETFVLRPTMADYRSINDAFEYLFNSYYNAVGPQFSRPQRGLVTRPGVEAVHEYRAHVDRWMDTLFERAAAGDADLAEDVIGIGLHHEQQHQELILTDFKHLLSFNPLRPVYREKREERQQRQERQEREERQSGRAAERIGTPGWLEHPGGLVEIGHAGDGFAYDNETPRHKVFLRPFRLASRLVTCGEYRAFIEDGGYERPEPWLSDGWATVQAERWRAPLYWERRDGEWWHHTLTGFRPVDDAEPVCHVSYYEADAYARWAGARLASEAEWETVAAAAPIEGNFVEEGNWHPVASAAPAADTSPSQLYGDVWEWTQSPYTSYPGYRPPEGAIGEYNAKFMCNQMVLRGGSCATPRSHMRATYRNFFPPSARWQFAGIRLAADGDR